jgi:hypothetical protein
MAIAWLYRRQYSDAGLQMLTVVDPGGLRAAGQALAAALAMVPVSLLLAVPSSSVWMFLVAAIASVAYVAATMRFAVARDDASARGLLLVSLGSLLSILVAAVAFGAAFLGASATGMLAQVLQHGGRRWQVADFDDFAAVEKAHRSMGLSGIHAGADCPGLPQNCQPDCCAAVSTNASFLALQVPIASSESKLVLLAVVRCCVPDSPVVIAVLKIEPHFGRTCLALCAVQFCSAAAIECFGFYSTLLDTFEPTPFPPKLAMFSKPMLVEFLPNARFQCLGWPMLCSIAPSADHPSTVLVAV